MGRAGVSRWRRGSPVLLGARGGTLPLLLPGRLPDLGLHRPAPLSAKHLRAHRWCLGSTRPIGPRAGGHQDSPSTWDTGLLILEESDRSLGRHAAAPRGESREAGVVFSTAPSARPWHTGPHQRFQSLETTRRAAPEPFAPEGSLFGAHGPPTSTAPGVPVTYGALKTVQINTPRAQGYVEGVTSIAPGHQGSMQVRGDTAHGSWLLALPWLGGVTSCSRRARPGGSEQLPPPLPLLPSQGPPWTHVPYLLCCRPLLILLTPLPLILGLSQFPHLGNGPLRSFLEGCGEHPEPRLREHLLRGSPLCPPSALHTGRPHCS